MPNQETLDLAAERFGYLHAEFDKAFAARAFEPSRVVAWFHERGLCVDASLHPIVAGEILVEPLEVLN